MKSKLKSTAILFVLAAMMTACQQAVKEQKTAAAESASGLEITPLVEKVLSAEEQEALTPDEVIAILREGNERFVNNDLTARDHSAQVRNSAQGQYPKAVVLSCLDKHHRRDQGSKPYPAGNGGQRGDQDCRSHL